LLHGLSDLIPPGGKLIELAPRSALHGYMLERRAESSSEMVELAESDFSTFRKNRITERSVVADGDGNPGDDSSGSLRVNLNGEFPRSPCGLIPANELPSRLRHEGTESKGPAPKVPPPANEHRVDTRARWRRVGRTLTAVTERRHQLPTRCAAGGSSGVSFRGRIAHGAVRAPEYRAKRLDAGPHSCSCCLGSKSERPT